MALEYPPDWKFAPADRAEAMPMAVVESIREIVVKISSGAKSKQGVIEAFKEEFSSVAGVRYAWSSNYDWALSDLEYAIGAAAKNAATFIDAYWSGLQRVKQLGVPCPPIDTVNDMLASSGVPFEIRPPKLLRRDPDAVIEESVPLDDVDLSSSSRYELGELLGEGGFGRVFQASRKTSLGTFNFALKVLDPSPFVEDREKATKRFEREIKALLSIQHRGIVPYVDAGFDAHRRPYIVMPFVQGRNIRDAVEGVAHKDRLFLLAEVLCAIGYAHQNNILHRDLKPSNIIVREADRQPVIVDFGNAYLFDFLDSKTITSTAVGTMGYIPSEVLADPTKRSPLHDIYSCGVIAYEIFMRRRPDPNAYRRLADVYPELASLDSIIQKAIAGAASRYETAEEFRAALLEATASL